MDKKFLEECLAKGMSTRDIEKICDKRRSVIAYWIHKYNLENNMRYKKLPNYKFDKIDSKEKAYVLGFILCDGYISDKNDICVATSMRDKEVVEFISRNIFSNVMYDNTLNRDKRRFPRARTTRRIGDIIKFVGGSAKKDRHYPRVRDDMERYLIQGAFDADGCLTWGRRKDKDRIWQKICFNSQLKVLEGIQQYLINKLDISTSIRPKSHEDCYVLEFSNLNDVLKFCEHIYPDEEFVILKRKYLKYKALRLELEENGGTAQRAQYRAEPAEQEGVETNGGVATCLNNRDSIQD